MVATVRNEGVDIVVGSIILLILLWKGTQLLYFNGCYIGCSVGGGLIKLTEGVVDDN